MSGYGPDAPKCRPRCRPIRRQTNPPRTRRRLRLRLGLGLHGRDLLGSAGGSRASPKTLRRPPVAWAHPCPRRTSPGPAPSGWRALFLFPALSLVLALSPERACYSSAPALPVPPGRARGRGLPVRPTGRSAVGRSGGARSQPAPLAARPRSLDPSLLPSLGARGRSGSRENGCGHAVLRDGCSVARATTSAARRAEDLLVQPFVPVRSRAAMPGDPLWDRQRRRAPPQLASSPISGGACRLPARLGHVCVTRITAAQKNRRSPGRGTAGCQASVPIGLPFRPAHARCELVLLS
jgi:hypothetical protein